MPDVTVRVSGLGKEYSRGSHEAYATFRESLVKRLRRPLGDGAQRRSKLWALRDASFEVSSGEVVGIVGRNGAGKTTLLKILSRVTRPTRGWAEVRGRLGALLEVGTGFHPELTGRENVYLNGAILGMRRREIDRRFDEIVAFAEIGDALDTPVKHYSSGMYVRLAFAVAAHLEPDILIVDEVLSVGDTAFQLKCIGRIEQVGHQGRTVLIVSHNMSQITALCSRALLLHEGRIVHDGPVRDVVAAYVSTVLPTQTVDLVSLAHAGAGRYARLTRLEILDEAGRPSCTFTMGGGFVARISLACHSRMPDCEVGLRIGSVTGIAIHYLTSTWEGLRIDLREGEHVFEVSVPHMWLFPGKYILSAWISRDGYWSDDNVQGITTIEVLSSDVTGHMKGLANNFEKYANTGCETYVPCRWQRKEQPQG